MPGRSRRTDMAYTFVLFSVGTMDDFEVFYRRNLRLVYAMALARGVPQTEAEDVTQETFLRAWRHFGLLSEMQPLAQRAWLVQAMRNLATDFWRRAATFSRSIFPIRATPCCAGSTHWAKWSDSIARSATIRRTLSSLLRARRSKENLSRALLRMRAWDGAPREKAITAVSGGGTPVPLRSRLLRLT